LIGAEDITLRLHDVEHRMMHGVRKVKLIIDEI